MNYKGKPNSFRPPHLDPVPYKTVGICLKPCPHKGVKCSECYSHRFYKEYQANNVEKAEKTNNPE